MIPDPGPILYACVVEGATVLAEFIPGGGGGGDDELASVAARCREAAPRFHAYYSHTARGRTYAFLFSAPFLFFAIAHASLGPTRVRLLLHRLRHASLSSPPPSTQHLPLLLRQVALSLPSDAHHDPHRTPSQTPTHDLDGRGGGDDEEDEDDDYGGRRKGRTTRVPAAEANLAVRKPVAERAWGRHVRMVLLLDLVVCSLLFAIWLSICRGFQCIS